MISSGLVCFQMPAVCHRASGYCIQLFLLAEHWRPGPELNPERPALRQTEGQSLPGCTDLSTPDVCAEQEGSSCQHCGLWSVERGFSCHCLLPCAQPPVVWAPCIEGAGEAERQVTCSGAEDSRRWEAAALALAIRLRRTWGHFLPSASLVTSW